MKPNRRSKFTTCAGDSCAESVISRLATENVRDGSKVISLPEACELMERHENDPQFVVLDLRSPADFQSGHLGGAINLEYSSPIEFEMAVDNLERGSTYLIYCYGGGRSAEVSLLMEDMGFRKIYDMTQGLNSWRAAACPLDVGLAA